MDLSNKHNIFLIGIKGVAMAGLAVIFLKMGKSVTGVDVDEPQITDELLKKHNISYLIGFDSKNFPEDVDLLVYSAAHGGADNPLVKLAKEKGIVVINQAELLGKLMDLFKTRIAVTGTHGKTTTSSLLTYALIRLGVSPSYMVGAPSFSGYEGGDYGKKDYFVIEADEYAVDPPKDKTVKFLHLRPTHILVTNIDFDHPDVFATLDDVKKEFAKFFKGRKLTVCADDTNLMDVVSQFPKDSYTTYGFDTEAHIRIGDILKSPDHTEFELFENGAPQGIFSIKLFGRKSVSNAAGVYATLRQLGFESDKIRAAIKDFSGVKRRFEEKFYVNKTYLFDDYAHHPAEIESVIEATRSRFPKHKIVIAFQPHTYSRTKALLPEFATALSKADQAFVFPIFSSAREKKEEFNVSVKDIEQRAKELGSETVIAVESKEDLLAKLKGVLADNQVVFTMGAGDIYTLSGDIIKLLKNTVK
ncbi:UDP-N-acetylmuramate--L-alanine ligase [Candidatus Roizmanbacteria bacterium RIFCSPLOWO2_12_FULL_40_12]|uniref:UDP-N-acetylmuramate--L-alanine ligase n=1 Tax=Candidatus Roizmanbacteria bacterium RIFCSPLOWO2_01_FULL_40_42 TaxID=1802066 RepID=A0A1F7J4U3_9BACT|nr:MAG: UDP-N-acetylmuramate--L-alanine ligase [Candidatus Roizmanbacteria bacterium RIFCSPHIGHO2_01_FULL_40_98]OGK27389.1 MAG: UDP-N-acetylmuramate--L-alanine ligase [Candidatus Roizmanbacteria bacterium RIFCSPHIGHO2_02_FULL_40_53]OGK30738.1 MAG: UDP-N-acetylmuramate--L-alanine ligase [Candidatus Roizmanbacteria bacterium RIFCSPHIGHO2_12_41_18]OGK36188.1 MAG: UDP-N-acetylmuramate--L-alanine ligase [Candidatus Roizmanbacteria bacterium RIFCSPHIGHO2_12_FULL_40_130]OGK50623.1 MAG: UDP-N-acetylmur